MDLSHLIDIRSIVSSLVVAAILAIIAFVWRKRGFLVSKIKAIGLSLRLPEVKERFLDIYQRVFQSNRKIEVGQSLQDYIESFREWTSKSEIGITLPITVDSITTIYHNLTSISISALPLDLSLYRLDIELLKPGYMRYSRTILGISGSEFSRLARLFYFWEIVES